MERFGGQDYHDWHPDGPAVVYLRWSESVFPFAPPPTTEHARKPATKTRSTKTVNLYDDNLQIEIDRYVVFIFILLICPWIQQDNSRYGTLLVNLFLKDYPISAEIDF